MPFEKVKILVVEDSFVKRELLKNILISEPSFEVVKAFGAGESAIQYVKSEEVDLITLDINLPGIDGFETARRILAIKKIPIIIISSIRDKNNEQFLLKAMKENGALAFLDSPPPLGTPDFERAKRKIIITIKVLTDNLSFNVHPSAAIPSQGIKKNYDFSDVKIIVIGASTGGPPILEKIISSLPPDFRIPIVIVQHILRGFEELLAKSIQNFSKLKIKLAEDRETLKGGVVYISPSEHKMSIDKFGVISLFETKDDSPILNTVSHLFASTANAYGDKAVAVLLTGMGRDGAKELKYLKDIGAYTIAQDRESSAIFGMPGEAARLNAAIDVMSPSQIALKLAQINDAVKRSGK